MRAYDLYRALLHMKVLHKSEANYQYILHCLRQLAEISYTRNLIDEALQYSRIEQTMYEAALLNLENSSDSNENNVAGVSNAQKRISAFNRLAQLFKTTGNDVCV